MTVRRQTLLVFSLALLAVSAGCGGGDSATATPEVDDPYYRQGQQLVKQGRTQEALSAYLKVIDRRGEMASAESHLEAGIIYLNHSKDPVEAYHHFRQYLSQQPNARDSKRVQSLLETAKRDVVITLGRQQAGDPGMRTELLDQIENLKRTNEALNAELVALRNSATAPVIRQTRAPIGADLTTVRAIVPEIAPIIPVEEASPVSAAPGSTPPRDTMTAPGNPNANRPAPPTRPGASTTPATGTRKHTVEPGDSLYAIAKKYYGTANNAKADAIYEANRDVMKNKGDLRPGMEIKIP